LAAYTVAATDIGKYEVALAANTEDVITFGGAAADATITDLTHLEVIHHSGTSPLYFRFGGAATVRGDNCYVVAPGTAVKVQPPTSGDTAVSVISAAAVVYSVANGG
jgi:hypothetical protein